MVSPVTHETGLEGQHQATASNPYLPPIWQSGLQEDTFESQHHGAGQQNAHATQSKGFLERLVDGIFSPIKTIVTDALSLPKVMWNKLWGKDHGHGGGGESHGSNGHGGPVEILPKQGFMSANLGDETMMPPPPGDNPFNLPDHYNYIGNLTM